MMAVTAVCCGQDPGPSTGRMGLGLYIEGVTRTDILYFYEYPVARITLSVHSPSNLVVEPEFGFLRRESEQSNTRNKSLQAGLGMYRLFRKNSIGISPGIKGAISKSLYVEEIGEPDEVTYSTKTIMLGPAIVMEYFFGEHFSFGGELGLKYSKREYRRDPKLADYHEDNVLYWYTETGIRLRFYFGS